MLRKLFKISMSLLASMSCISSAHAQLQFNLTPGVTPISQSIYHLHMLAFWLCVGIAVVVFGVMFYALFRHRKSKGRKPATFHEHTTIEILWAVVPLLLLIILAIPATKVLIQMHDTNDTDINIKVTGYQWKWQYEYLNEGVQFFSNLLTTDKQINNLAAKAPDYLLEVDHPLVLPTNTKVRFLITSNDVIHSWWVPAFGVKKDAVPGFIHEAWTYIEKPGRYVGQCAELCGIGHGFMPIVVEAVSPEKYKAWLDKQRTDKQAQAQAADQDWTMQALMDKGKTVYDTHCSVCHQANGEGNAAFPGLKDSPIAKGPVDKHIDVVLNGVSGTAMQAFTGQLNDVDIAAVVTYERNAWGNNMNDLVQPKTIKADRAKTTAQAETTASPTIVATKPQQPMRETMTKQELMLLGQQVYKKYCSVCHRDNGAGMPPTFPALHDSPTITGPAAKHIDIVLNGVAGTSMQAFKSQLNDEELAAVITYERNAWNNETGSIVQPKEIKAARTSVEKE